MNSQQIIDKKSTQWVSQFDLDVQALDEWMTRQLNCLVGRNLNFTTPKRRNARRQNATAQNSRG